MPELYKESEVRFMTQTKKKAFSLKGFDWKRVVIGNRKPIIALIGFGLTTLAASQPHWAFLGGISAASIFGVIEFYCTKK